MVIVDDEALLGRCSDRHNLSTLVQPNMVLLVEEAELQVNPPATRVVNSDGLDQVTTPGDGQKTALVGSKLHQQVSLTPWGVPCSLGNNPTTRMMPI